MVQLMISHEISNHGHSLSHYGGGIAQLEDWVTILVVLFLLLNPKVDRVRRRTTVGDHQQVHQSIVVVICRNHPNNGGCVGEHRPRTLQRHNRELGVIIRPVEELNVVALLRYGDDVSSNLHVDLYDLSLFTSAYAIMIPLKLLRFTST